MIPILYEKTETQFRSNGLGRLSDCVSCLVTEERNGVYECEFEYPITGQHYSDILEGRIIYTTHDESRDPQPFDIYGRTAPIDGVVTFYARHISYRLSEITVKPFTSGSCADTINRLGAQSINANPFSFWTNKAVTGSFNMEVPKSCREILGGSEGSILDTFGTGEYEFDKFNVRLYLHRGNDTDVTIRYGKNLLDITNDIDYQNAYTAVVPYWYGSDNSAEAEAEADTSVLVTLDGWAISSGHASYNGRVVLVPMDLSGEWQDPPTKEQLRAKAVSRMNNNEPWLPEQNIKVDFVALWQTDEYAAYAPLQRVHLCDTVTVSYPDLGVDEVSKKVVKTVYDSLLERYDEIELGNLYGSLAGLINAEHQRQIQEALEALKIAIGDRNKSFEYEMTAAIQNATEKISGGLGGYVYLKPNANGYPEEILIMNTQNINTATKLWRWNMGGLGYSSNGYSGPYGTAITMDGAIVANYITSGTLNANIIKAGVLSDLNNNTSLDLSTGTFTMKKGSIKIGNTFEVSTTGQLTARGGNIGGWAIGPNNLSYGTAGTAGYALLSPTGGIAIGNNAFKVTADGTLTMTKGSITIGSAFSVSSAGALSATAGSIGGWNIGPNNLSYGTAGTAGYALLSPTGGIAIGNNAFKVSADGTMTMTKGSITIGNKFSVSSTGVLTCSEASISGASFVGNVVAESGRIGRLLINENRGVYVSDGNYEFAICDYTRMSSADTILELKVISGGRTTSPFQLFGNGRLLVWPSDSEATFEISDDVDMSAEGGRLCIDSDGVYISSYLDEDGIHMGGLTAGIGSQLLIYGSIIRKSSSTRRIKKDIRDIQTDVTCLYDLPVREFKYKAHPETDYIGLIAEEVDEVLPAAAVHEEDGQCADWDARVIVPAMLKLIQDQHTEIESLKTAVAKLS